MMEVNGEVSHVTIWAAAKLEVKRNFWFGSRCTANVGALHWLHTPLFQLGFWV